jgi:squalene cyclase
VHAAKAQQKQMHNKGVARICVCTTKAWQKQMHVQQKNNKNKGPQWGPPFAHKKKKSLGTSNKTTSNRLDNSTKMNHHHFQNYTKTGIQACDGKRRENWAWGEERGEGRGRG